MNTPTAPATDMEPIPDFLEVSNRKPLSPELQAKLDADAKAKQSAPAKDAGVDEALRKAQAEAKTAKARGRIAKLKAQQAGETTKMPASGKEAVAIIKKGTNPVKTPGPKEQQLRNMKTAPTAKAPAAAKPAAKPAAPKQEKPVKTATKKTAPRKPAKKAKAASTARRAPAATRATPKASGKPQAARAGKAAPSGMVVEILKLASRPKGATPAELNELTNWTGAPWKWLFSNPKKTGYCDRWGYKFDVVKDDDGTHYKVTKLAA